MIGLRATTAVALALVGTTAWAQIGVDPGTVRFVSVPAQPRADAAFDLLLVVPTHTGGPFCTAAAPQVHVQAQERNIEIVLGAALGSDCTSTRNLPAKVGVPGLAAGDYGLRVLASGTEPGAVILSGQIQVRQRAASQTVPATGIWGTPSLPGSGITLHHRNDTIVAAVFGYEAGDARNPVWQLGSASLRDAEIGLVMERYRGGHCLGCTDPGAGVPTGEKNLISIEFTEPRQGWVRLNTGAPLPLVHLDVAASLARLDGPAVGRESLGLPSFEGRWLFQLDSRTALIDVTLRQAGLQADAVVFRDTRALTPNEERFRIDCRRAATGAARCVLTSEFSDGQQIIASRPVAEFASGSIQDGFVSGITAAGESGDQGNACVGVRVLANRVH